MRLKDKFSIITGAADGIGRAAAELFAREGAKLVLADWPDRPLDQAVASVEAAGGEVLALAVDVTQRGDVEAMVQQGVAAFGPPDVLLHTSGLYVEAGKSLTEVSEEEFDETLQVNLKSAVHLIKAVAPHMIEAKRGSIVTTSSAGAYMGGDTIAYAAAKSALISLTRNVGIEFARYGIRANTICPGAADLGANGPAFDPELIDRMSMFGRPASPQEVAQLALYLASDESSYSTAAAYLADGGWLAMRPGMAVR